MFFYVSQYDTGDIAQLRTLPIPSRDLKVLKEVPGASGIIFYLGVFERGDIIYVRDLWALIAYSKESETLLEIKAVFDYEGIEVRVIFDDASSIDSSADAYWHREVARINYLCSQFMRILLDPGDI